MINRVTLSKKAVSDLRKVPKYMPIRKKSPILKTMEKMMGEPLSLGLLIKSYRQSEDLTQGEMAKTLGISNAHLSQIEKNHKFLSPERARDFAKKLGYSEQMFIMLSLQDQLTRAGLKYTITLKKAA